jgi:hypothetical protein
MRADDAALQHETQIPMVPCGKGRPQAGGYSECCSIVPHNASIWASSCAAFSWIDLDFKVCWQLTQTKDFALFDQWVANWRDLIDFQIVPVRNSTEGSRRNLKENLIDGNRFDPIIACPFVPAAL